MSSSCSRCPWFLSALCVIAANACHRPSVGGDEADTAGHEETSRSEVGDTDDSYSPASGSTNASSSTTTSDTGVTTDPASCAFDWTLTMSEVIPTVAIIEWAVALSAVDAAEIHYGLDTRYGLVAPVDLSAPAHRTLLLGMKPARDYHVRIVATRDGMHCDSPDFVASTGPVTNARLPSLTVDTHDAAARAAGFKVLSDWQGGNAFILDTDGDYVWWYAGPGGGGFGGGDISRARMSYDGHAMWMRNVNVGGGSSTVTRVTMDGTNVQRFTMADGHHDLTVLPDGSVAYIVHDGSGCDEVVEQDPSGKTRVVYNLRGDLTPSGGSLPEECHSNSIHYNVFDESYTVSSLNYDTYTKFTRDGELIWKLGGSSSDFEGDGAIWNRQHGHHNLADDRLLIFNNGAVGSSSLAIEIRLDLAARTATRVWEYDGGAQSIVMGDVQRLHNGNTLVTYSDKGLIHEVDPSGNLVESLSFELGGAVGYVNHRSSLYGPPPR